METATTLQEIDTRLEALVEEAYQAFGKYRVKRLLDVCTVCCIDREEENRLVTLSVAGISHEDLNTYATAAFAALPSVPEEFKHFLPRYLELLKDFAIPGAITETTLVRLKQYRQLAEWPEQEVRLLHDFAEALFAKALLSYPIQSDGLLLWIDELLILFEKGGIEINPLLEQWSAHTGHTSLLHLQDLLLNSLNPQKGYCLNNTFASDEFSRVMQEWLISHRQIFADRIEHYIADDNNQDEGELNRMSWAYEILMHQFSWSGQLI